MERQCILVQMCKESNALGLKKKFKKTLSLGMEKTTNLCCQKAHQRMGNCIVLVIDTHTNSLQSCFCQTNLSLFRELLMETLAMLCVTITKTDSCTAPGGKNYIFCNLGVNIMTSSQSDCPWELIQCRNVCDR